MDIHTATLGYERWLAGHARLVAADLDRKHLRMKEGAFPFMRATFYRWCQHWLRLAGAERKATRVAAVGDLHLENFGTWRDREGRLVWGINDFDEVTRLPWSQDLIRLATSAHLAIAGRRLHLRRRDACVALLGGYRAGIEAGGRPFVLEERNAWLRRAATSEQRSPTVFWAKLDALPTARNPDLDAVAVLANAMPEPGLRLRICRRVAGMGSLGRPRLVAVGEWQGARLAREAKGAAPSAWFWARGRAGRDGRGAVAGDAPRGAGAHSADPMVHHVGQWLVRRLAPDCVRIELAELLRTRDEERLLAAMGFETANVHLRTGHGARAAIAAELRARKDGSRWLNDLAKTFAVVVEHDFQSWREGPPG